jgi:hypothetical protein
MYFHVFVIMFPLADDWLRKTESRLLYELDPQKPRLYVMPIASVLGKVPLLRAGNTGTIPYRLKGQAVERRLYPGGKADTAPDKGDGSRLWYVNTWAMKWSQTE